MSMTIAKHPPGQAQLDAQLMEAITAAYCEALRLSHRHFDLGRTMDRVYERIHDPRLANHPYRPEAIASFRALNDQQLAYAATFEEAIERMTLLWDQMSREGRQRYHRTLDLPLARDGIRHWLGGDIETVGDLSDVPF